MNVRNTEALAALIRTVDGDHSLRAGALAEALAARGCLVPAALSDGQLSLLEQQMEMADDFAAARAALERIAKGET